MKNVVTVMNVQVLKHAKNLCLGLGLLSSGIGSLNAQNLVNDASTQPDLELISSIVGDSFEVSLADNPSTGYGWSAVHDSNYLSLNSETYVSGGGAVGSGGTLTYNYTALKAGQTTLLFMLKRPFETSVLEVREIIVNISEKEPIYDLVFSVLLNESFSIALSSNPTTGFRWEITKIDSGAVKLVGEKFTRNSIAVGSGGTQIFTLQALARGTYEIELAYKRSWEKDSLETKRVKVEVR